MHALRVWELKASNGCLYSSALQYYAKSRVVLYAPRIMNLFPVCSILKFEVFPAAAAMPPPIAFVATVLVQPFKICLEG
jgi:hypothetical protein